MLRDLRYAFLALSRSPAFTLVCVLSIAGGLSAGTAAFALMNAVLFRPLGVADGAALYRIYTGARSGELYSSSSYLDFEAFRGQRGVIAAACATERVSANVGHAGFVELRDGAIVNPGCFDALRPATPLGRYFTGADAIATASPMPLVISHHFWRERFAGDPSAVGQTLMMNGVAVTIVGVAARGFVGTSLDGGADFWAPIYLAPALLPPGTLQDPAARTFSVFARLAPGVSPQQAEAALAVTAEGLRRLDERAWAQESGATRRVTVIRELDARFAGSPGGPVGIIAGVLAAVAIVIGIACVNLATMFLARGAARAREVSIRLALGASRARMVRMLLAESVVVALLGAAVATVTLAAGVRLFTAYRPAAVPAFDLALDWRVLAFLAALALAAAMLFGLAPAVHTLRAAVNDGLRGQAPTRRVGRFRLRAREGLIVLQVAASVALLVVATLFVRARGDGRALSPGFDVDGVAALPVEFTALPDADVPLWREAMLAAAREVPGVERVSLGRIVPLTGSAMEVALTGEDGVTRHVHANGISSGYFGTMGMPLLVGRGFAPRDDAGGAPVAIVSAEFARRAWGGGSPLGRTIVVDSVRTEVVGVAADARYRALTEPFREVIYLPISRMRQKHFIVHARVAGGAATLLALEQAVRRTDPRASVARAEFLRERIDAATAPERAAQWAGGIIGVVQLALALMALWGLVTYAVQRRTTEMGIRLALGAAPSSLVRLVMRPAVAAIALGLAAGLILGVLFARVLQATSVGLAPIDSLAVLPVATLFLLVTMAATWWPARRAGQQDPAVSLRRE